MFLTQTDLSISPISSDSPPPDMALLPQSAWDALFDNMEKGQQLYVVLDGAKIPALPEQLAVSDMPHLSLFAGAAQVELGESGPWIAKADPGSSLIRNFFTSEDEGRAHWGLWERAAGVFLRSTASLEQLRAHLRYFTKLRDETGAWVYFRFYEDWVLRTYLETYRDQPQRLVGLLCTRQGDWIEFITRHQRIGASDDLKSAAPDRCPATIDAPLRAGFAHARWQQFKDRLFAALKNDETMPSAVDRDQIAKVADAARDRGYRSEQAIYNVARAWLLIQGGPVGLRHIEQQVDPQGRMTAAERAKQMYQVAKMQTDPAQLPKMSGERHA